MTGEDPMQTACFSVHELQRLQVLLSEEGLERILRPLHCWVSTRDDLRQLIRICPDAFGRGRLFGRRVLLANCPNHREQIARRLSRPGRQIAILRTFARPTFRELSKLPDTNRTSQDSCCR